jgi:hypothetical protein
MIKLQPITFTGTKIIRRTEIKESHDASDFDALDGILKLTPDNVDTSSLSFKNGSLEYNIRLKNGHNIHLQGNTILRVSKTLSDENDKGTRKQTYFELTLYFEKLNKELQLKFQAAMKHLDEIWVKLPEEQLIKTISSRFWQQFASL